MNYGGAILKKHNLIQNYNLNPEKILFEYLNENFEKIPKNDHIIKLLKNNETINDMGNIEKNSTYAKVLTSLRCINTQKYYTIKNTDRNVFKNQKKLNNTQHSDVVSEKGFSNYMTYTACNSFNNNNSEFLPKFIKKYSDSMLRRSSEPCMHFLNKLDTDLVEFYKRSNHFKKTLNFSVITEHFSKKIKNYENIIKMNNVHTDKWRNLKKLCYSKPHTSLDLSREIICERKLSINPSLSELKTMSSFFGSRKSQNGQMDCSLESGSNETDEFKTLFSQPSMDLNSSLFTKESEESKDYIKTKEKGNYDDLKRVNSRFNDINGNFNSSVDSNHSDDSDGSNDSDSSNDSDICDDSLDYKITESSEKSDNSESCEFSESTDKDVKSNINYTITNLSKMNIKINDKTEPKVKNTFPSIESYKTEKCSQISTLDNAILKNEKETKNLLYSLKQSNNHEKNINVKYMTLPDDVLYKTRKSITNSKDTTLSHRSKEYNFKNLQKNRKFTIYTHLYKSDMDLGEKRLKLCSLKFRSNSNNNTINKNDLDKNYSIENLKIKKFCKSQLSKSLKKSSINKTKLTIPTSKKRKGCSVKLHSNLSKDFILPTELHISSLNIPQNLNLPVEINVPTNTEIPLHMNQNLNQTIKQKINEYNDYKSSSTSKNDKIHSSQFLNKINKNDEIIKNSSNSLVSHLFSKKIKNQQSVENTDSNTSIASSLRRKRIYRINLSKKKTKEIFKLNQELDSENHDNDRKNFSKESLKFNTNRNDNKYLSIFEMTTVLNKRIKSKSSGSLRLDLKSSLFVTKDQLSTDQNMIYKKLRKEYSQQSKHVIQI
ncbi:hypothetical protein A3Q56_03156 [Intoshia linei]|uniref:Uncharacterized protein n=1 Tax=Intoshia linei TaxID=1819745 RepID=A0A177B685_9BILA|nr:hypothetical protein A3Q56_03156 [Intoshia linei]